MFGHAPFPDGHSIAAQFDGLREAGRAFASRAADSVVARNVADVLLAVSIKAFDAPRQAGRMLEAVEWWNDVLRGGHLLYDIGGLDRELGGYRLVVLPDQLAMSDAEIDAVRDYVEAGGSLIATGGSAAIDEHGRPRSQPGLAEVVGATTSGPAGNAFTYVTAVDPTLADGLPGTPLVINREAVRVIPTTGRPVLWTAKPERPFGAGTTLLWGYPPPDDRLEDVLGVAHEFGRGRSLYVGVGLDGPPVGEPWATGGLEAVWARRLAENLVRDLLPVPTLVTDASPAVEIVLDEAEDRWRLHLVDHSAGDARYLTTVGPARISAPIRVRLDHGRIVADEAIRGDGRPLLMRRIEGVPGDHDRRAGDRRPRGAAARRCSSGDMIAAWRTPHRHGRRRRRLVRAAIPRAHC